MGVLQNLQDLKDARMDVLFAEKNGDVKYPDLLEKYNKTAKEFADSAIGFSFNIRKRYDPQCPYCHFVGYVSAELQDADVFLCVHPETGTQVVIQWGESKDSCWYSHRGKIEQDGKVVVDTGCCKDGD